MSSHILPFSPRRVPYQYTTTIRGRRFRIVWGWNHVGQFFTFALQDPETGELLWRRPVLYGADLLYGCTVNGLQGLALIPIDDAGAYIKEGITLENAETIKMRLIEIG